MLHVHRIGFNGTWPCTVFFAKSEDDSQIALTIARGFNTPKWNPMERQHTRTHTMWRNGSKHDVKSSHGIFVAPQGVDELSLSGIVH